MTAPFRIPTLKPVQTQVSDAPVYNALVSLAHLNSVAADARPRPTRPGSQNEVFELVDTWVVNAAAALTPAQRQANYVIFEGLGDALIPDREYPSMSEYLAALDALSPTELRDRALRRIARTASQESSDPAPSPADLLADSEVFQAHIGRLYHNDPIDEALQSEVHRLLNEPAELHDLITGHLRTVWETVLEPDWRKRAPLLRALVTALRGRSFPEASAPETIRAVVGRDLPADTTAQLADVVKIVFVPSPYVMLYASRFGSTDTLWVFVALSTVTGWTLRQAPIKPVEVLNRLSPLADETRLRILELLAQEGELSSQDLIDQLGISQSGVSRHLKALGSYIVERRGEGATKHYRLNMNHLDWTFVTLRRFLTSVEPQAMPATHSRPTAQDLSKNARGFAPQPGNRVGPRARKPTSVEAPSELLRFMDDQGRITGFPTKRRDVLTLLEYLAGKFELDRSYTEKEVNSILSANLHPHYNDFVTIRRELYNFQFLGRERDGSRYWRIARTAEQTAEQSLQEPSESADASAE